MTNINNSKSPLHLKNISLAHVNIKAFHSEHLFFLPLHSPGIQRGESQRWWGNGWRLFPSLQRTGVSSCSKLALRIQDTCGQFQVLPSIPEASLWRADCCSKTSLALACCCRTFSPTSLLSHLFPFPTDADSSTHLRHPVLWHTQSGLWSLPWASSLLGVDEF